MMRTSYLSLAAIAILAATLSSCASPGSGRERSNEADGSTDAVATVPVVQASRVDLSGDLVLTAEFEPFQEIDVMSKVAGYLKEIKVDIGDHVQEGQLLATLEIPEMADDLVRAGASIDQADADVTTARDEVQRAESAYNIAHLYVNRIESVAKTEPGLVPQQEVDEVRSRDQVAQAQLSAAKSALRAAEQKTRIVRSDEARVKTLMNYTQITAPFTGVVTKRYANTGSMIQAGTASQSQAMPIIRLSQNNLLRLVLPVPESAVPHIRAGETVSVKVPSLNRTFPGRVARSAEKVQQSTRTMDTEVDVPNPSLTLVPGLYAEVDLKTDQRQNVLSVPLDAVERSGDTARVYTVQEPGVIHIVTVTAGLESAQRVEILSGLEPGQSVIVGRLAGLKEGQKVRPQPASFDTQGK
jgi:RND family efflux transporter MFP subunit